MFQNGLQIHFQTLRRRCDLVILKLQLYIVIIVRITIYEQLQLQLQLQHEGQVPGEPGDQVVTMVTMLCRLGRLRPCPPPASGPGPGPAAPPAGRGSTTRSTPAAACRSVHSAGCITVANLSVQN